MCGFHIGERIKVVFIDGNLSEGNVVTKYGIFVEEDDHYFCIKPDGEEKPLRVGHNFICKVHPLEVKT